MLCDDNDDVMMCCFFVLFRGFLFLVLFMNGLTELWLQCCLNIWEQNKQRQKKKQTKKNKYHKLISFLFLKTARNTRTQPTTSLSAYTTGTVRLSKRIILYCFASVYTSALWGSNLPCSQPMGGRNISYLLWQFVRTKPEETLRKTSAA